MNVPSVKQLTDVIRRAIYLSDVGTVEDAAREVHKLYSPIVTGAWDEGYAAARQMARWWGHTDGWEDEPENPYVSGS